MTSPSESNSRNVPLLDINRSNRPLWNDIQHAIGEVCRSGQFLHGPPVKELEQALARQTGAKYGIGCASGSDALLLSLMALDLGPGDEVITPSFTFFATASAVWRLGAAPVFVDIDPKTFNLNTDAVEAAITGATRAIIPVHLFGQCAEMDPLLEIAKKRGLTVIEDAAQAIGAEYKTRPAGSMGDIGCFSFYPTKNLGGFGDGGMIVTSDKRLAEKIRLLAAHGMHPRYHHHRVGVNSRLDSIQAAVLSVKRMHLADWTEARRQNAARYGVLFAAAGLESAVELPMCSANRFHVWNQYTLRIPQGRRDRWRKELAARGVGTEVYYPLPLHLQPCFSDLGYNVGSLPETEQAANEVLSLPIFPELTALEQQRVVSAVAEIYREETFSNEEPTRRRLAG